VNIRLLVDQQFFLDLKKSKQIEFQFKAKEHTTKA
jgi:hypothetical protein